MLKRLSSQGLRCIQRQSLVQSRLCSQTSSIEEPTQSVINPLEHDDYFDVKRLTKRIDLFNNLVHLGHKVGTRNPYMLPYIFGNRLGVDILDLDQTQERMKEALNFIAHIAYREGIILFISRNLQTIPLVEKAAEECGEYSHCRQWMTGTLTNSVVKFGAITRLPDLCIFLSTQNTVFEQHDAVVEAAKMYIPSVAVVDSACDPRLVTYPIPGNDDTPCAVELYLKLFKGAILKGKQQRKLDKNQKEIIGVVKSSASTSVS